MRQSARSSFTDTEIVDDPERCFPLAPEDFARVNPNTGTAPVFRTRRDAEITGHLRSSSGAGGQVRMGMSAGRGLFSYKQATLQYDLRLHLFRTSAQLEVMRASILSRAIGGRGVKELYLPLYQGRMIGQFDHRANSVRVNPESTHNPYLSEEVSDEQHADPSFLLSLSTGSQRMKVEVLRHCFRSDVRMIHCCSWGFETRTLHGREHRRD